MRVVIILLLGIGLASASYVLPDTVIPKHYDVALAFDIDPKHDFPYFGVVKIDLKSLKDTSLIVLHAQGYTIDNSKVSLTGPKGSVPIASITLNETLSFLQLCLNEKIQENQNYTLTIPFSGNLKADLDGMYISNYVDTTTNVKEYLIATQFEAISARKGFPCFDEPMYKSTFRMTIAHNKNFSAVSNMPLESSSSQNSMEAYWPWSVMNEKFQSDISSFTWDIFTTSVPMSTYLVAFVVSKFTYLKSPAGLSDTEFKIWSRKDASGQTEYASTVGPKVLTFYEKWFNVSFPLPKQDMIAIPDFSAGAMENWGLITYRETALLYDREESSLNSKERVAEVIAHELAHQWFGNLVTMKWWSDLWLNEGFATFVASIGVHAVEPNWRIKDTNAVGEMKTVWQKDSLASSHPVSVPLDDPKRISEIFDDISYSKGSILIRMMTNFLGEDVFRKAINQYLVKHSYGNAEQNDLWLELTDVAQKHNALTRNVTVKEIMDTWTTQTGYPLLTVERDYTDKSVAISQKRYLALGSVSQSTSAWWVPLNVLCEKDQRDQPALLHWLSDTEGIDTAMRYEHGAEANEWILMNSNMYALVRVNYDSKNWELLTSALNSDGYSEIPELSRVQLLTDAFELAWSSKLDYDVALRIANYLSRETEYLPLEAGLSAIARIENLLSRDPEYGAVQKYIRKVITPAYTKHSGFGMRRNENDLLSAKTQVMATRWACRARVPGCEEAAIELFHTWMESDTPDDDNPIPIDLRPTVYCTAISRGSVAHWRFLLARQRNANVASVRISMLSALTCTREVWLIYQYLEWALNPDSEVRRQDAGTVLAGVARAPVGYHAAKDVVFNRIEELYRSFGSQGRRLGQVVRSIVEQFTTQRELDEFVEWREQNVKYLDAAKLAIDQAVEMAKVNIAWLTKYKKLVVKKMRDFSQDEDYEALYLNYMKNHSNRRRFHYLWVLTTILQILTIHRI